MDKKFTELISPLQTNGALRLRGSAILILAKSPGVWRGGNRFKALQHEIHQSCRAEHLAVPPTKFNY
jgi:hypothetical protein